MVLFATFALKLYEMLGLLKKLFGPKVDLKQKLQEGAIIVDVRSSGEFAGGHVKGSKNIPLGSISSKIKTIQKWNIPIITCCASDIRSRNANKNTAKH